jgi:hypothetical protein
MLTERAKYAIKGVVEDMSEAEKLRWARKGPESLTRYLIRTMDYPPPLSTEEHKVLGQKLKAELEGNRAEAERIVAAALGLNG